jgi:hypothetical protein
MNWDTSLSHSPTVPVWLTLAAAGVFAIIVLVALLRAEKSVANGVLAIIALLAIGTAGAAATRGFAPSGGSVSAETQSSPQISIAALPALSCIDDLAGEAVLTACEKVLFGSAESAAAAVSYAAARITQLTAFGDVAAANSKMTPELQGLRGAIERDRYGLVAYVLLVRDHCTPAECAAFGSLADHNKIVANMDERVYDGLVARYASTWNAPAVVGAIAGLPPSVPTGRPTNAEFPSAASTPAVSIMTPEPAAPRAPATAANAPSPRPAATTPPPTLAAAVRKPAPKPRPAPPVQLSPAAPASAPVPAPAPAASNE